MCCQYSARRECTRTNENKVPAGVRSEVFPVQELQLEAKPAAELASKYHSLYR